MSKCIVECYREVSRRASPYRLQRRRLDRMGDDAPHREGMQKPYKIRGDFKTPGEQLNPLRRYLLSRVGRPWDRVRSEMSEHMNRNSAVQNHIWQHAVDYVEVNTFTGEDGRVYFNDRGSYWRGRGAVRAVEDSFALVYVCPRTGCLRAVPRRHRRPRTPPYRRVVIDRKHQAHKVHGIWHVVTLEKVPEKVFRPYDERERGFYAGKSGEWARPPYEDVLAGTRYDEGASSNLPSCLRVIRRREEYSRRVYGSEGVYAAHKRPCDSKELRRLGLANDAGLDGGMPRRR